jgi:hypothetical protein
VGGALTEIAVISFDMNVEGASPAGSRSLSMAGHWMHLVLFSKPRSACTPSTFQPDLPFARRSAAPSQAMLTIMMTMSLFPNIPPFLFSHKV